MSSHQEWKLNIHDIGIMGFSAGGHNASLLATCYNRELYTPKDEIDLQDARPDFAILCYPAINAAEELRAGLARKKDFALPEYINRILQKYSTDLLVHSDVPPIFIMETDNDTTTYSENSIRFYLACRKHQVSAELHIFKEGGHGFGLGQKNTYVENWTDTLINWLKQGAE